MLPYLARYTHRVAIADSRLIALDERGVTFKRKDYRAKRKKRYKTMTLAVGEFMRRFLLHVLPTGFHRIRHYVLIANAGRRENLARARQLLHVPSESGDQPTASDAKAEPVQQTYVCPTCGAPMIIIDTLVRGQPIRAPPSQRGAA